MANVSGTVSEFTPVFAAFGAAAAIIFTGSLCTDTHWIVHAYMMVHVTIYSIGLYYAVELMCVNV